MVDQPHQHRANAALAQRTALLATEGKLSHCVIRCVHMVVSAGPIVSAPPFGIRTGVTRWFPI